MSNKHSIHYPNNLISNNKEMSRSDMPANNLESLWSRSLTGGITPFLGSCSMACSYQLELVSLVSTIYQQRPEIVQLLPTIKDIAVNTPIPSTPAINRSSTSTCGYYFLTIRDRKDARLCCATTMETRRSRSNMSLDIRDFNWYQRDVEWNKFFHKVRHPPVECFFLIQQ